VSSNDSKELQVLQEILKWIKFSGMKDVKATLESMLDSPQKRLAYQLSDGNHSRDQVQTASGIKGNEAMSDLWRGWPRSGLGESIEIRKGMKRFKRSFDLNDFGIEYPKPKEEGPSASEDAERESGEGVQEKIV
jgi:hypothetical protein